MDVIYAVIVARARWQAVRWHQTTCKVQITQQCIPAKLSQEDPCELLRIAMMQPIANVDVLS